MITLGLTGSIGMGKSATAQHFRSLGVAVHDADAAVHKLYAGPAAALIETRFPGAVRDGAVDRAALAALVLGDAAAIRDLEAMVHPLVAADRDAFLAAARQTSARSVVLDIPLLFETGAEALVDVVVVVSAPFSVQRSRVLARPGMTAARFQQIVQRQMPDAEKRRRAHAIIATHRSLEDAGRQAAALLRALAAA